MSGSADAATALRTAALARYDALRDRVAEVARAKIKISEVDDLVEIAKAANTLSLSSEALAEAADALHKAADAALVAMMAETGCASFVTEHHTVSLRDGIPSVDITDPKAVPDEFKTAREPIPDKAKIRDLLRDKGDCNWAHMLPGKPHLQRRARQ